MTRPRRVQFVVKTSKLCNLRCRYCYEFEQLGDKARMPLEKLERLYRHVADWYRTLDTPTELEFVWHGGEPLLLPPEYFRRTFDAQQRVFGEIALRNVVQTNLTKLDDDRLELLRAFDGVGVSVDLFGGLRVDASGRDSARKVVGNIDRMREAGIEFGAITVLTQANAPKMRKIVQFFDELGVESLRILPLFDGAYSDQHAGYEITHEAVLEVFRDVFEQLLERDSRLRVEPVHRFVNQVIHSHTPGSVRNRYDKRDWEPIYVVDTNGDLYSYAETYEPGFVHGNVFEQSMVECIASEGHSNAIRAAEERMKAVCSECRFFGSCDGSPIAEDAGRQVDALDGRLRCVVEQGMLEFLSRRLEELGVIDAGSGRVTLPAPAATLSHIERFPLIEGVKIHFEDHAPDEIERRLLVCEGTTTKVEPPSDGLAYLKAAIVPNGSWRGPRAQELELLVGEGSPSGWRVGLDVGVFKIPGNVMEPLEAIFDEFGTRSELDEAKYRDHTTHPEWPVAYEQLVEHLKARFSLREHQPTIVRLATALPGMVTVTKDRVLDRDRLYYVGLHLDTWEKIPMQQRDHARNRICVNMGKEARHFLFVNLTVRQMHRLLRRSEPDKLSDYYGTDLGHEFMTSYAGYPVIRLTVGPREAYIAPTDNMVHDATSVGKAHPDVAMHILGWWGLRTAASAAGERTATAPHAITPRPISHQPISR